MQGDDGVDAAGEEAARGDGVFFDELGEVVEPACYGGGGGVRVWGMGFWGGGGGGRREGGRDTDCEGEEREAEEEAEVAD